MEEYTLINHHTGEEHELAFENIADIQAALREIKAFNGRTYPYNRDGRKIRGKINTWECFEDTLEKMSKVKIPVTDY